MPSRGRHRRGVLGLAALVLAATAVVLLVTRDAGHEGPASPIAREKPSDEEPALVGRAPSGTGEPAALTPGAAGVETEGEEGSAPVVMRLSGVVLDPEGRPLDGVPVRILVSQYSGLESPQAGPVAETTSDASGHFAFRFEPWAAPDGDDHWLRVHVEAVHPLFLAAVASFNLSLSAANAETRTREDIELRFHAPFRVRCEVFDEGGAPIAGATCRWVGTWYTVRTPGGVPYEAVTDAAGVGELLLPVLGDAASVTLHTTGVHYVLVRAAGYAPVLSPSLRVYETDPERPIVVPITLPRSAAIAGVLEDDQGRALAGLPFELTGERGATSSRMAWCEALENAPRTDEAGAFSVEAAPGPWELEFRAEGYVPARIAAEAGGARLRVRLVRQPRLVLRYFHPDGSQATVTGYSLETDTYSMRSSGRGRQQLVLDDLPPGRYRMAAYFRGRAVPFEHTIELQPGENEPQDLVVPEAPGRHLVGRILDENGGPLAGRLSLVALDESGEEALDDLDLEVGDDGHFAFEGLDPGRYRLDAHAADHAETQREIELGATDPEPLELRMRRGATLRVALPPRPAGATWEWQLQVRTATDGVIESLGREPDEEGFLRFRLLPAGRTLVLLESPTFRADPVPHDPYVAEIDLVDGETAEHVFPQPPLVRVRGRILDARGEPIRQYSINLCRVPADEVLSQETADCFYGWKDLMTDDDGRFTAEGLLPGRYAALSVRHDGVPLSFEVDGRPDQEVVLDAR